MEDLESKSNNDILFDIKQMEADFLNYHDIYRYENKNRKVY